MRIIRGAALLGLVAGALWLPGCCWASRWGVDTFCKDPTPSPIKVTGLVRVMKNAHKKEDMGTFVAYEYHDGAAAWAVTTVGATTTLALTPGESVCRIALPNPPDPETMMPVVHDGPSLCTWANANDPEHAPYRLYDLVPESIESATDCGP